MKISQDLRLVGWEVEVEVCQQLNSEISTKLQSDQNHAAHNQNMPQFTMLLISSLGPKYFLVEIDQEELFGDFDIEEPY